VWPFQTLAVPGAAKLLPGRPIHVVARRPVSLAALACSLRPQLLTGQLAVAILVELLQCLGGVLDLVRRNLAAAVRVNRRQDRRPELRTRAIGTALTVARPLLVPCRAFPFVARPVMVAAFVFAPLLLMPIFRSRPFFFAPSVIARVVFLSPPIVTWTVLILSRVITRPILVPPSILAPLLVGSRFIAPVVITPAAIIPRPLVVSSFLLAAATVVAPFIAVRVPIFGRRTLSLIAVPRLVIGQPRQTPRDRAQQHQSQCVLTHNASCQGKVRRNPAPARLQSIESG
jgi:hypothetical protein